jgi:hypothetical protein
MSCRFRLRPPESPVDIAGRHRSKVSMIVIGPPQQGAEIGECLGFIGIGACAIDRIAHWLWHGEKLACARDAADAPGIGEQTVVTDAMATAREDMDEKAADELVMTDPHRALAATRTSLNVRGRYGMHSHAAAIVMRKPEPSV